MFKKISLLILSCFPLFMSGQSNPTALAPGIGIQRLMTIQNGAVRVVLDPVQGDLLYATTSGQIYRVNYNGTTYTESLVHTAADHGIAYVQGMIAHDSVLYVSGNNNSTAPFTQGKISRGVLQPNGTRVWSTVLLTDDYQTAGYFDHLLSGLAVSNDGDSLAVCNGARGDHGEIHTRFGAFPGLRNPPLTTQVFLIPARDSVVITLPNNAQALASSPYLFAQGIRNTFDMAFDAQGRLFGVENSGDYDHNEEMNWLRRGRHYGFPWRMGTSDNPQQFPGFNPLSDPRIPRHSWSWREGFWYNDPTFPPPPSGVVFEDPIMNIGPDADKFRDATGAVRDASDLGISLGTFTAHRSPLGLVFDKEGVLDPAYKSDAFMLSWTPGLDSCGCIVIGGDSSIGPFVDPSQDLLHLDLTYDSIIDNFTLSATRLIDGFSNPVDAELDSVYLYVIENGYGGTSGLYRITLPGDSTAVACTPPANDSCVNAIDLGSDFGLLACSDSVITYQDSTTCATPDTLIGCISGSNQFYGDTWYRIQGTGRELKMILSGDLPVTLGLYAGQTCDSLITVECRDSLTLADTLTLSLAGVHWIRIGSVVDSLPLHFQLQVFALPLSLTLANIQGTSCIGCQDGNAVYQVMHGTPPYVISILPNAGSISLDSIYNLPSGSYSVCATDASGCTACDSLIILENPTGLSDVLNMETSFRLFPNPVRDDFTLLISSGLIGMECSIVDSHGRLVLSRVLEEELMLFETSGWEGGLYSLMVNGQTRRFLLIR